MSRLSFLMTAVALLPAISATAQEFRIYTRVSLVDSPGDADRPGKSEVIARSLTLFHAGKTYDYIDSVGEVIVFEPAQHRFLILHTLKDVATSVDFDELSNLLKVARQETESYVMRLEGEADESSKRKAAQLRFQLNPKFDEDWDPQSRKVSLSSRYLRYVATGANEVGSPEALESWARYADAMCRLNYVLHPGAMFPEPRLAVNASLARKRLMPVEVELMTDGEARLHLSAQHQIHWELDAKDRSLIHHWEQLLKRKMLNQKAGQMLSFQDYQRAVLASAPKKR